MYNKKKLTGLIAVTIMALIMGTTVCGCGKTNISQGGAESSVVDTIESSSESEAEAVESEGAAQGTEVSEGTESKESEEPEASEPKEPFVADRSEVFDLISQMNVGWNLGNTLDAHGVSTVSAETYWGNPKTTQEMIDAVAAQGFNTIRVPVTWKDHVGAAPDYKIDEAWMNRVQEIVDYCVKDDLFIILDTHHEPDGWLVPTEEKYDAVSLELKQIWTQVAERFKDYDNKLLFEGMNEPRVKGSDQEWNGGTDAEKAVIAKLNQDFIDAVRATGGNNETRCLVICQYGTNGNTNSMKTLQIPEDNYIAVAVHLYIPYYFTYDPNPGSIFEWDGSKKQSTTLSLKEINNSLIKKGVPAIITEFGCMRKTKEVNGKTIDNEEEVIKWLTDYLHVTEMFDIPCVWWDNGIYDKDGEKFAIFNRQDCSWYSKAIADTLVNSTSTESHREEQQ